MREITCLHANVAFQVPFRVDEYPFDVVRCPGPCGELFRASDLLMAAAVYPLTIVPRGPADAVLNGAAMSKKE